nr:hypothetical protein [Streptomyces fuscichromogenes]
MRIVRGTRRGGSRDIPLVIAVGTAGVVPLAGTLDRALAIALARVVALAGALIGRSPVPGR